jgi:hypothetical protein
LGLASSALAGHAVSHNDTLTPTRIQMILRSLYEYRITGSLTLPEVSYLTLIKLTDRPSVQRSTSSHPGTFRRQ